MKLTISGSLFVAFSGLSIALLGLEITALQGGGKIGATVLNPSLIALSNRTIRQTLLACDRAMSSPNVHFQPASNNIKTASFCADFSARVARWIPTNGLSHLVAAQSAHRFGDKRARDASLQNSQKYAPFEGWLAERRIALLINQITPETKFTVDLYTADLRTLLTTQSGAELLAEIYLHNPAVRPKLSRAAQNSSDSDQNRFLNQLRLRQAVN